MRAQIVGRVHTRGGVSWVHWYATLIDPVSGWPVWHDDGRDLAYLSDEARDVAAAFTRCAALGQRFRPWVDIVEDAGRDL